MDKVLAGREKTAEKLNLSAQSKEARSKFGVGKNNPNIAIFYRNHKILKEGRTKSQ